MVKCMGLGQDRSKMKDSITFLFVLMLSAHFFFEINAYLPLASAIFESVELRDIVVKSFEEKDIVARFADPFKQNKELHQGKMYQIESNIVPIKEDVLRVTYIVQIKESDSGFTEQLSWFSAEVPYTQTMNSAQSWVPDQPGKYSIGVTVWKDLDMAVALSPLYEFEVEVL